MKIYIIRKIVIVLIMVMPLISWSGCKKQAKCGCGKDVLFSLKNELMDHSSINFVDSTSASFTIGYSTYIFCNPIEMYSIYSGMNKNDQLILSGDAFWECTYLMNSGSGSSSSYYYYYKVYNIEVTNMEPYLYGKK